VKKYIAPIVFGSMAVIVIAALGLFYSTIFKHIPGVGFARVLIILIALGLAGTMVAVMVIRIREIKKEDKDDLSKY